MAIEAFSNSYEEARLRRLEDNKKRFEDLGISKISKSLLELKPVNSPLSQRGPRKQRSYDVYATEPRRSSRARNPVASYRDDVTDGVAFPSFRKRRNNGGSWASYLARPLEEVKTASYEERAGAIQVAEKLQENLQSTHPTFIKSMVRSHVYSCFWLGLPRAFCSKYLPKTDQNMVLEDEDGNEYDATYLAQRTGLSGGWRGFALERKLDDGDALVFELIEPARFKIHIVRAGYEQDGDAEEEDPFTSPGYVEEQENDKLKRQKKGGPQQSVKVHEESKKAKKMKKTPAKKAKGEVSKNNCSDESNGGELNSKRLRRSTRSSTKSSNE